MSIENQKFKKSKKRKMPKNNSNVKKTLTEVEEFLSSEKIKKENNSMASTCLFGENVFDTLSDVSSDDSDIQITKVTKVGTLPTHIIPKTSSVKTFDDCLDYLTKPPICTIKSLKNYLIYDDKLSEENDLTDSSSSDSSEIEDNQDIIMLDNGESFVIDGASVPLSATAPGIQSDEKVKRKRNRKSKTRFPNNPELRNEPKMFKYWSQRYDLFQRFDMGIKLDKESWFSVTPENIAKEHSELCEESDTVLDGFCGAGGNTIQFANRCKKVYAIDIDQVKVDLTKNNCYVYGIPEDKVTVMKDDFHFFCSLYNKSEDKTSAIISLPNIQVVYLSPPWGGQDYLHTDESSSAPIFNLSSIDLNKLLASARLLHPRLIIVFLPRNTNIDQLKCFAAPNETVTVLKHSSNYKNNKCSKIKAITAVYKSS